MANMMDKNQEKLLEWLKTEVVPKVTKSLGKPYKVVNLDISSPENCFFLSSVFFVDIKFENKDECIHMVVKKPPDDITSIVFDFEKLFHNEILFYKKFVGNSKRFPKLLYAVESKEDIQKTVLITENITYLGYRMCPQNYDIPFEYAIAGVREIARFHGMGYAMKTRDPKSFFKKVCDLQETRYYEENKFSKFVNVIARRPIIYLRSQKYDPKFCDKMDLYMKNAFQNIMIRAIKPVEPLAVLCHGDFTRNNIFFRQTKNGLEGMLLDFAMLTYSSPSVDLSTYLFISCTGDDVSCRFDQIFKAYYQTLVEYLKNEGINVQESYSYDVMLADYKRNAMFGYIISLFFSPHLRGQLSEIEFDFESDFEPDEVPYEAINHGGERVSKEFADILLDFRRTGYLDHILDL